VICVTQLILAVSWVTFLKTPVNGKITMSEEDLVEKMGSGEPKTSETWY
jgi:hypothetical protein